MINYQINNHTHVLVLSLYNTSYCNEERVILLGDTGSGWMPTRHFSMDFCEFLRSECSINNLCWVFRCIWLWSCVQYPSNGVTYIDPPSSRYWKHAILAIFRAELKGYSLWFLYNMLSFLMITCTQNDTLQKEKQ